MLAAKKIPYFTMEPSIFTANAWKRHDGSNGCVPLNTQQGVSMDRLAPGVAPPPPPPKPPKPTAEQIKAQKGDEALQKQLKKQQAKTPPPPKPKPEEKKAVQPEAEDCPKPPIFDMQDIPGAMEKMGWPVSAKCSRRWFGSASHIYNDKPNSEQPIDDAIITLDWALKFGNVNDKYNQLLSKDIYQEDAAFLAKKYLRRKLTDMFVAKGLAKFDFNTTSEIKDLRQFHLDWQFQFTKLSSWDTMDGVYLTDLTGTLANFGIYVAIGNANATAERYYKYNNHAKTKTYCLDPTVEITHIYVYIKDNYSFNDSGSSSQYLGHWNKRGVITTPGGLVSQATNSKYFQTDLGNSNKVESDWSTKVESIDKPVDVRKGVISKFREPDVYFPIYNKNYNQWREKHNRGGDFMLYSKPKYLQLRVPIKFKLDTICKEPVKM